VGFFQAARRCFEKYNVSRFHTVVEDSVEGGTSKVDYVAVVEGEPKALCKEMSPSVRATSELNLEGKTSVYIYGIY
jgi:hypothetical protein